jgi:hypothetical protein
MRSLYSDPLTFWSRVLFRLGLVLGLLGVAPGVIDFLIFNGAAIVIAIVALYTLLPLAALSLLAAAGLWIASKLQK